MAIVKILKSSKCFAAVEYNESRCKNGEAKLLKAGNFSSATNVLGYLEMLNFWSSKNSRIKNPQFHVVISLKHDELSQDELVDVAEKWLIEMGYKDIPYLIYLHTNTNHTHIHIVTSRVDKLGNKVDHCFEKERAVQCLQKNLFKSEEKTIRKQLFEILHYSFSTLFQFKELATSCGFKTKFDSDKLICSKDGNTVVLPFNLIEFCSQRYRHIIPDNQKKKIQGLIYKYATRVSKENFSPYMRRKFGLEFIFYGKKNDINGYTIIDHKNHSIYKGSEVFGSKKISELFELSNDLSDIELIIKDILEENPLCDYELFMSILQREYFYHLDNQFNVIDSSTGEVQQKLKDEVIQQLNYNHKVQFYSNKFKPYNDELVSIVSKIAQVSVSDVKKIAIFTKPSSDILYYYNSILTDGIQSNCNLRDFLHIHRLALVVTPSDYYLLDYINGISISGKDMNITFDSIRKSVINNERPLANKDYDENINEHVIFNNVSCLPAISFVDFTGLFFATAAGSGHNMKKKKRNIL